LLCGGSDLTRAGGREGERDPVAPRRGKKKSKDANWNNVWSGYVHKAYDASPQGKITTI